MRCSLRRSSGRSAARRSPMVIRSRGRSKVCRQMYAKASSPSRVYGSVTVVRPRNASSGSARQPLGLGHPVALHQADVVDEDLAQTGDGVRDVDGAAPVLLGHDRRLVEAGVGLLAHGGEDLDVVVDAAELIGHFHQAELGEVPHVGGQLAGDARVGGQALDVLGEVLVDAIDEDGHRRLDRAQSRHQVAVGVGAAALELARREVEEADEVIDDAVELLVGDQARQSGAHLKTPHRPEVLEGGQGDRREPGLGPGEGRRREEGQGLPAEDLVTDRFVEEVADGQTGGPSLALVEDALGLEEQGLSESLGADDDELVVSVRIQKTVDLGCAVEQGLVEVLRHADVVGVHRPCAHNDLPSRPARLPRA